MKKFNRSRVVNPLSGYLQIAKLMNRILPLRM